MSEEYEDTKEEHYVALYIIFDIQQMLNLQSAFDINLKPILGQK